MTSQSLLFSFGASQKTSNLYTYSSPFSLASDPRPTGCPSHRQDPTLGMPYSFPCIYNCNEEHSLILFFYYLSLFFKETRHKNKQSNSKTELITVLATVCKCVFSLPKNMLLYIISEYVLLQMTSRWIKGSAVLTRVYTDQFLNTWCHGDHVKGCYQQR